MIVVVRKGVYDDKRKVLDWFPTILSIVNTFQNESRPLDCMCIPFSLCMNFFSDMLYYIDVRMLLSNTTQHTEWVIEIAADK